MPGEGWMLPLGLQGGSELCRQPRSDVQSRFGHLAPVVLHLACGQDSKIEEQLSTSATAVTLFHICHHCYHCHHCHHSLPKQIREFSVGMGTLPNLAELRWYQV